MTSMQRAVNKPSLHRELTEIARPWIKARMDNPVVTALLEGTLEPAIMRRWVEQDHLYLRTYARVFARLASLAPDDHVATLIDGAHYTLHTEMARLSELADLFGADLTAPAMGTACADYTRHLTTNADSYERGAIAVLPCMIGFSAIGIMIEPPNDPRYRRWVEMYSSGDFQEYAARFAALVDDLAVDRGDAVSIFETGMGMEVAMWDEAALFIARAAPPQEKMSPLPRV
jgi:thiaminase (transcriptional activator TenA)